MNSRQRLHHVLCKGRWVGAFISAMGDDTFAQGEESKELIKSTWIFWIAKR